LGSVDSAHRGKTVNQEQTFASSRKVTREAALAAFREIAPNADEDLLDAKALRTYPSYRYVWTGSYRPWCEEMGLAAMPCPPEQLLAYVKYLKAAGKAPATIDNYVASIATVLRLNGFALDRLLVVEHMKAYRKRGGPQRRARALVGKELKALVARLDPEGARDCRDASLFVLGFAFAGRGSELVGLDWLRAGGATYGGTGVLSVEHRGYAVQLLTSKRKDTTVEIAIPFAEMPSLKVWLDRWIKHARIMPGEPLFRAIGRWGHVQSARLAPDAVRKILKARMLEHARATGLSDKEAILLARQYSAHSMRRGYCSSASEAGLSLGEIRRRSRHSTDEVLGRYIRDAESWRSSGLGEGVGF
jgi:integrase